MIASIRMLVDADGSPNGHTVYSYLSGEVYTPDSEPPMSESLAASFIASKRAVTCDVDGNPVGKPADKRATKGAEKPASAVDAEK